MPFVRRAALLFVFQILAAAGPAQAADPITLSLGGRLREYFYVADQTTAPGEHLSSTGMINDVRLNFEGRTVLDNGITVSAVAHIYVLSPFNRNLNEAFVEVNTGVGKFRAGDTDGVNSRILGDPVPEALLTRDEEIVGEAIKARTGITVFDAFSFRRFTGTDAGVAYETPEIAGFKLGVAYHPELSATAGAAPFDKQLVPSNGVDVSAAYSGDFTGGSYRVGSGYFHSSPSANGLDGNTAVDVIAGITYGGWDFSGGYMNVSPSSGLDETSWTVGALYALGPFRISADYMHGIRDVVRDGSRRERIDRETIQGSYKLAPGVSLGITGFRATQTDATGLNWDGTGVLSGIKLAF